MSDLHAQIMNIPSEVRAYPTARNNEEWKDGYETGHRDARHAAAELALSADARIRKLEEALALLWANFPTDRDLAEAGWEELEINAACDAYDKARAALKEQS